MEWITSIARSQSRPFHVAVTGNKRTLLLDLRYPVAPLLEWRNVHLGENQNTVQFVENDFSIFEPNCLSSCDTLYTWGRRQGEILFHFYDSPNQETNLPPSSQFVQKIDPFWKHPITSVSSYSFMHKKSHAEYLLDKYDNPLWEPLIGSAIIPNASNSSTFSFYQMDQTGALYTQAFTTKRPEFHKDSYFSLANEDSLLRDIDKREGRCINQTLDLYGSMNQDIPHFEADHEMLDVGNMVECRLKIMNSLTAKNLNSPR